MKLLKYRRVKMKQEGEFVRMPEVLRAIRDLWRQYNLEATCNTLLDLWEEEQTEYICKIEEWIKEDHIPDDTDLRTLCRVYEERLRPRSCYRRART